ncbi:MAG: beta-lactamase family protein [Butyrivibrio sp.]|nr:beta-lactamase family protein [Butyrivibrio sp.]
MFSFTKMLPEEAGIPSSCIKKLILTLDEKEIPMHSLLIMKDDKLVFEKYYAPYQRDTLHRMFSISKSITALGISLLEDEGKISIDDPIVKYFPEYTSENTHPWIRMTTIKNMLMMCTCHAACTYKVDMTSDWVESFFITPPTNKPGTIFHYDTSAAHVLCALVEKLSGMDLLSYLKDRAFKYLDFSEDSYMIKDPFGVSMGGSGLMATPMDLMKITYLLYKKGTVTCSDGKERTLLNPSFLLAATGNLTDTCMTAPILGEAQGYGMQIWQNEKGGFLLYGMGGQLGIAIPDRNMLIVTTADTQAVQGGNQIIYDSIYEHLYPYVKNSPISNISDENQSSYDSMKETADSLAIAPPRLPASRRSDIVPRFFGYELKDADDVIPNSKSIKHDGDNNFVKLKYSLLENRSGFTSMTVNLSEDGYSSLRFRVPDGDREKKYDISFGIGKMCEGDFPIYGTHYTAGAIWLRENVLFIKVHLIGESVGSIRFELYFENGDVTVFMKKIEETYFKEFDGHLYGTLMS